MEKSFFDSVVNQDQKEKMKFIDALGNMEEQKIIQERQRELKELKNKISSELANKTKNKKLFGTTDQKEIEWLEKTITDIIRFSGTSLPKTVQKKLVKEMVLEIISLGKLHEFLMDKSVSEIMVNAPDEVWIERKGEPIKTDVKFESEEEVYELATKIANNIGRSVNISNPIVDARLPDGSRVNIVIPPIAIKGTTITIRKFFKEKLTIHDLIRFGTLSEEAARFIEDAVISRANILVSGGTGAGKTSTLNVLSNFIPDNERIITIEDAAELQLNSAHLVPMEARVANAEGKGEVTVRDLVKTALRMYPTRIIIGEVRDGTAFDLLQAMNTGHDGSMATIHANDPYSCISRLESLVQMAGTNMTPADIRKQIASAIDIIIQISKFSDGTRKITHITEVSEFDEHNNRVIMKDIYRYKHIGIENGKFVGNLVFTGHKVNKYLQDKFTMHNKNYFKSVGLEEPEDKKFSEIT